MQKNNTQSNIMPSLDEMSWEEAKENLSRAPKLREWIEKIGSCPFFEPEPAWLRQFYEGSGLVIYRALLQAVISQQLSNQAAEAVLARVKQAFEKDFPMPESVLSGDPEILRQCGLSRQKIASLKDIAQKVRENFFPARGKARQMSDRALREKLMQVKGVGPWTADIVLIFGFKRPDIFAVDDLGVREGWRLIQGEEERLSPEALAKAGERFSPFRSALTWYCWQVKERFHKRP